MGAGRPAEHGDMGAVRIQRTAAQGRRARGHGQGRRPAVRGPSFPRGRPAAGQSEPGPLDVVRVLGRHGARHEPLRGQINRRRL